MFSFSRGVFLAHFLLSTIVANRSDRDGMLAVQVMLAPDTIPYNVLQVS